MKHSLQFIGRSCVDEAPGMAKESQEGLLFESVKFQIWSKNDI